MADVAVITGGASGIGEACVVQLASAGSEVWIVDQNADQAERTAEQI